MRPIYLKYEALILGILSLGLIALVWQVVVDLGWINPFFVSSPSRVFEALLTQLENGTLVQHIGATLLAFAIALAISASLGIALGLIAGWYRDVESALEPFIWFTYSAPTIAFYPIFIAFLGYGMATIVLIAVLFSLTPIYANTLSGIRNADRDLVRAAISFGAKPADIFLKVALPGSVPIIVAGLRLGVGRALTGVVVAELFGATSGLGFSIAQYSQRLQTTGMMVSIVTVIVLGVILTQILSWIERRTDSWRV